LDRATIELPDTDAPTLSDDVIVIEEQPAKAAEKPRTPFKAKLALKVDLGDKSRLKGRGIDTGLTGVLALRAAPGTPLRADGVVKTADGTFLAYGQRLSVERGVFSFAGPIDDPRLDIVAMRKNQDVEAGVAVSGSARQPIIKLVSRPSLPDSEKLAWLVLGHGLAGAERDDFALLSTATRVLFSKRDAPTMEQQMAHALGVSEIGLRGSGELQSRVLSVGKRISSRVNVTYERALSGASTLVAINYKLSPRWSVRVSGGSESAFDAFYSLSFD
jgi:translocation and assembly module TamB